MFLNKFFKRRHRRSNISVGRSGAKGRGNTEKLKIFIILSVVLMCCILGLVVYFFARELKNLAPVEQKKISDTDSIGLSEQDYNLRVLTLVNPDTPVPFDFKLNLENFNENISCDKDITSQLKLMLKSAKDTGFNLTIEKGYVDPESQQKLHDKKVSEFIALGYSKVKADDEASKTEPRGGYSELQTGLSVDITKEGLSVEEFSKTSEFKWLSDNCINYGFILRYPESKKEKTKSSFSPLRYRFVGIENSKKMRTLNMCLEEYYEYMSVQNDW